LRSAIIRVAGKACVTFQAFITGRSGLVYHSLRATNILAQSSKPAALALAVSSAAGTKSGWNWLM
jgi:hypothetical protein